MEEFSLIDFDAIFKKSFRENNLTTRIHRYSLRIAPHGRDPDGSINGKRGFS